MAPLLSANIVVYQCYTTTFAMLVMTLEISVNPSVIAAGLNLKETTLF